MLDGDGRNAVFDHVYVHAGDARNFADFFTTLMAQWLQVRPVALTVVIAMMFPSRIFGITKLVDAPPACQLRIMRDMAAVASFIFSSTIVASPVRSDSIAALVTQCPICSSSRLSETA